MTAEYHEVRTVVEDLRDKGRTVIKSKDVCEALGIETSGGNLTSVGYRLNQLAESTPLVEIASRSGAANTYRLLDDEPEAIPDGGQPEHDLPALADAIERVLLDDEYDHQLTAGPYTVHERVISRNGATIRQVVVDYAGAQFWVVLPKGLADVVVEAIRERDAPADLEAATGGDR